MKHYILLIAGTLSLSTLLLTNASSDPFGIKSDLQNLTSLSPSIAYAASSSIVDGYQPAANNVIIWDTQDDNDMSFQNKLSNDDIEALCVSPSKELQEHPSYKRWCL